MISDADNDDNDDDDDDCIRLVMIMTIFGGGLGPPKPSRKMKKFNWKKVCVCLNMSANR